MLFVFGAVLLFRIQYTCVALQDKSSGVDTEISKAEVSAPSSGPEYPTKDFNRRVALVSVLAALGLFSSQRVDFGIPSLKDITAAALPYEEVSVQA